MGLRDYYSDEDIEELTWLISNDEKFEEVDKLLREILETHYPQFVALSKEEIAPEFDESLIHLNGRVSTMSNPFCNEMKIRGRIGTDIERPVEVGNSVVLNLSVGVQRPHAYELRENNPNKAKTDWFSVKIWGKDRIDYFTRQGIKKGDMVEVTGRMTSNLRETDDGKSTKFWGLQADDVRKVELVYTNSLKETPEPLKVEV